MDVEVHVEYAQVPKSNVSTESVDVLLTAQDSNVETMVVVVFVEYVDHTILVVPKINVSETH